jgi:cellulose synthase/poly-beta-1,6-N-acetylglucosamine synthase-like glycosyltransferase
MKKLITIMIPAYNEEKVLPILFERLKNLASKKSENSRTIETETPKNTESKEVTTNTDHTEGTTDGASGVTTYAVYTTISTDDSEARISAQIAGLLYDDGTGTCVHALTHSDGTKIELSSKILESPGNKYCGAVSKNLNELKSGMWSVVTNYTNSNQKYEGKSDVQSFEIK